MIELIRHIYDTAMTGFWPWLGTFLLLGVPCSAVAATFMGWFSRSSKVIHNTTIQDNGKKETPTGGTV